MARRRWMRILRVVLGALAALAIVILIAKHFLLDHAPVPEHSSYSVDMATVRRLASEIPGAPPSRVEALVVAQSFVPSFAVVAGTGFEDHEMVRTAYRAVYPDGTSVMVDAATNADLHEQMFAGDPFYPERFAQLQKALDASKLILVTHTHPDHIGGIAASPSLRSLVAKLRWTREQVNNDEQLERAAFPADVVSMIPVVEFEKYKAIAPGIVAIKAPGHTPGSQMVYVHLAGGQEYLFVGDIAWHGDNIEKLTGRPWLVAEWIIGEERTAVLEQLRTLHDLAEREPIELVVSHDAQQLERLVAAGKIEGGFRQGR